MILENSNGIVMIVNVNSLIDLEKRALEQTYFDKVTVYRMQKQEIDNITKQERQEILKNEPCALSKTNKISSNIENGINNIEGEYTLFLTKEIKKGDELHITLLNGRTYKAIAGEPNYHISHYEVAVSIKERA